LGRHEVLLQEPPPADLLERYAGWALLPANATAAGAVAARNAALGRAPLVPSTRDVTPANRSPYISDEELPPAMAAEDPDPAAGGASAPEVAPAPSPSAKAEMEREATTVPATDPEVSPEPVLVTGAVPPVAASGAGAGAGGAPTPVVSSVIEVTLGAHPRWRGGSSENAAALLATHLLEIACQTDADAWEFAVLDFSDDVRVADTFDAILDLTPHLIEYADGVSAQLKLDDVRQRLEQPASDRAHLTLFVLSNPRETLPDALERVLQAGPAAGVQALVWHAGNATSSPQPGDTVLTLADTPHLRIVGQPARNLQLPTPLTTTEAATLAEPLRQARA